LFEEAIANNNIVDNYEGQDGFLEEKDEEDIPIFTIIQGVDHFRRSTLKYFLDMETRIVDHVPWRFIWSL
jgi:hypothetical protein